MMAMPFHPSSLNYARHVTMTPQTKRPLGLLAATVAFTAFAASGAFADSAGATFSEGNKFTEETGEALYANVCQACHQVYPPATLAGTDNSAAPAPAE